MPQLPLIDIGQLLREEMLQVDSVIHTRLQSDVPLVARISQYIIAAGGKRIRPVLLLLLSGALGQKMRANTSSRQLWNLSTQQLYFTMM